jgi:hypothetical protein
MATKHALLSPSASHRWLNCTAAPRLEERVPDKESDYALEGTLAHAYCAKGLKGLLGLPADGEDREIEELKGKYFTDEMLGHVETYVQIVGNKLTEASRRVSDSRLIVEQRLDFTRWVPGSFGTADAVIITDGTLEVIDFKYGKGVEVSAEWNPQMMIYALGAIAEFEDEYNIRRVRMTIVQPRLENLSEFELDVPALMWWAADVLKPKAREAMSGEGRQNCGEWCRFCRVKNSCAKLAGECLTIAEEFAGQETVTDEDMARRILPKLATVKAWASSMEEYALEKALSGTVYEGFKLVEGRSIRKITDPGQLAERLIGKGFPSEKIFRPVELETLTSLERLVGKKDFAAIAEGLIEKPQGKPTLVPESDKRPAFNRAEDDFKNF